VPYKAVKVYMGDTGTSVNQGGASGSTGIQLGGKQMRMVARKHAACWSTWRRAAVGSGGQTRR